MDICDMLMLSALVKFVNNVYSLKKKKNRYFSLKVSCRGMAIAPQGVYKCTNTMGALQYTSLKCFAKSKLFLGCGSKASTRTLRLMKTIKHLFPRFVSIS